MPTKFLSILAIALPLTLVAGADSAASPTRAATSVAADPAPRAAGLRCFRRGVSKRKSSLGAHQWTAAQSTEWCVRGWGARARIVSVARRIRHTTGTNWRHISSGGFTDGDGGSAAVSEARFHFRLRYPYFEQNCRPRLRLKIHADGRSESGIRTGC